uniref:Uncharacterized protein n=1 Tax=Triticum urartu TaxID=4572 RepID=A0A8R7QLT4_TRIUA
MPTAQECAQRARVHADLQQLHRRAGLLHQERQVLHQRHGEAALHRHAPRRLPRPGRRALRPRPGRAPTRAQRRARLRGPVLPFGAAFFRGVRGGRPRRQPPGRARQPAPVHGLGRLGRHHRGALLRHRQERLPARVPGRRVPDHRRGRPLERRRRRHDDAQARPLQRQGARRHAGQRRRRAPGQGRHGGGPLLGHPGRRRRQLRHRALVEGPARAGPVDGGGVQHRQDGGAGRRGRPHQMAGRGAVSTQRHHPKGDRAGAAGHVPGPVPRRVRLAGGHDGRPVPGAGHDERRLPADELGAVGGHAVPELRQERHAGGGAPEQDHRAEQVQQGQVGLRPARHPQGGVGGHLPLVRQGRRRVHPAGAPRRVHGRRPRRRDAVPAPERRAVRDAVHRDVAAGGRGRRHGGDGMDPGPVRVDGAAREQEPSAGVRQLPGPGRRAERRGRHVRGRRGLGRALLRGQLPAAGGGEGGRGSHQLLQERAEHPAVALNARR